MPATSSPRPCTRQLAGKAARRALPAEPTAPAPAPAGEQKKEGEVIDAEYVDVDDKK